MHVSTWNLLLWPVTCVPSWVASANRLLPFHPPILVPLCFRTSWLPALCHFIHQSALCSSSRPETHSPSIRSISVWLHHLNIWHLHFQLLSTYVETLHPSLFSSLSIDIHTAWKWIPRGYRSCLWLIHVWIHWSFFCQWWTSVTVISCHMMGNRWTRMSRSVRHGSLDCCCFFHFTVLCFLIWFHCQISLVNILCHNVTSCGWVKHVGGDLCRSLFNDIIDIHGYQLHGLGKSRTALNEITNTFKMNETLYHGYI